jgi:HlyD family secretion protein
MLNKKIFMALAAALALIAVVGWVWWSRQPSTDNPLTLYGNVDIREVELAFRQPGRITKMAVDEGDAVKAGALLAEIDAQPLKDALAAAEAELQRAKAELQKQRAGNREQEVLRARQDVLAAQAGLQRADADLQRQAALQVDGIASVRTLEAARSARDEAAARVAALQQTASMLVAGSRKEDIAAAEARVLAAEAARAQAATALADARLLAPVNAIVSTRVREPGAMVGNKESVYTLSLRDPLYVRAYVGEPQLGRAVPGTPVTIKASSIAKTYKGQVGFVSPRAEFTPKSVETADLRTDLVYRLRIVVSDGDEQLRQGMPVTVQFGASPAASAK